MLDEIHDLVGRYLGDEITAAELQVRLPDGWDMDRSGDRDARRLVLLIMGHLSEFFNGDLPENELKERLGLLTPPTRIYWWGQRVSRLGFTASLSEATPVRADRSREVEPA